MYRNWRVPTKSTIDRRIWYWLYEIGLHREDKVEKTARIIREKFHIKEITASEIDIKKENTLRGHEI